MKKPKVTDTEVIDFSVASHQLGGKSGPLDAMASALSRLPAYAGRIVRIICDDASEFSQAFLAGEKTEDALEGRDGRHEPGRRLSRTETTIINRGPRPRARHRGGRA